MRVHVFNTAPELAEALAKDIADHLVQATTERGIASIAVSGGSTPRLFFQALSRHDLDWSNIRVTLVDERFVPADNERSNHKLVAENLLQNKAKAAYFLPLFQAEASPKDAAKLATVKTKAICDPFDIVVLGMGADGHTASFFPDSDNLYKALDLDEPRGVITMATANAGEARLTFNFSSLHDARFLVLHIEGTAKKATLEKTGSNEDEMPIRAVLNRAETPLDIYWAP